jgi:hypothetical protein
MSQINGDKARFQKNRKRKLQQRERSRALVANAAKPAATPVKTAKAAAPAKD